jgi:hypothetical protein
MRSTLPTERSLALDLVQQLLSIPNAQTLDDHSGVRHDVRNFLPAGTDYLGDVLPRSALQTLDSARLYAARELLAEREQRSGESSSFAKTARYVTLRDSLTSVCSRRADKRHEPSSSMSHRSESVASRTTDVALGTQLRSVTSGLASLAELFAVRRHHPLECVQP